MIRVYFAFLTHIGTYTSYLYDFIPESASIYNWLIDEFYLFNNEKLFIFISDNIDFSLLKCFIRTQLL